MVLGLVVAIAAAALYAHSAGEPAAQSPEEVSERGGEQNTPPVLWWTPAEPSALVPSPTVFVPTASTIPATATPVAPVISLSDAVPGRLAEDLKRLGIVIAGAEQPAKLTLAPAGDDVESAPLRVVWVYALAAPFPTVQDAISLADLRKMWSTPNSGVSPGSPLLVSPETEAAVSALWGEPAEGAVSVFPEDALLDEAWKRRTSWAILPFEDLEPRWKVLRIDGRSPIDEPFDVGGYPLKVTFVAHGQPEAEAALSTMVPKERSLITNEDPQGITTVVMTGVTALVRATAYAMETRGLLFPARDIHDWLASADITHISNEASFYTDCPYPNPASDLLYFCSRPSYLSLLEYVGADVVELSGNHNNDVKTYYGADVYGSTLQLYAEHGMQTFAGGMNIQDARKPAIVERNGIRFAFIGCNPAGPPAAWATDNSPGAAFCGDNQWLIDAIRQQREQGNLPIVTIQYFENYIDSALEAEKAFYRQIAEAGALVVNGSQAHTPKGMEFYHGAFIHYGLGNLFFDQMQTTATRQEFIDRHVFYGGKEISVELLTAMLEDYARPRPMTAAERAAFLNSIFKASGW